MKSMNVMICINKNFLIPAEVLITSILRNHLNYNIQIFIVHNDLFPKNINSVKKRFFKNKNLKIKFIKIQNSKFFSNLKTNNSRWPIEVFYRIFSAFILPQEIKRILYLDADIIVDKNIYEFYSSDFLSNYIIACEDTYVMLDNNYHNRIKSADSNIYFNSGVILFNLEKIRKKYLKEEIENIIKKYSSNLIFPDQDILNLIYKDKVLIKDYRKYNFICDKTRYSKKQYKINKKNAYIYHFGGGSNHKPWSYKYHGNLRKLWWKYANEIIAKKTYFKITLLNFFYQFIYYLKNIYKYLKKVYNYLIFKK